MAEQNTQPTKKVHAVNKKGTTNFFPADVWKNMKVKDDGTRNGWMEVGAGQKPEEVMAKANIPPEFKKMNATAPSAASKLVLTEDEKKSLIQSEIYAAILARKDEIEKEAIALADNTDSSLGPQIKVLADHIMQEHDTDIKDAGAVETAIQIMNRQKQQIHDLSVRIDEIHARVPPQPVEPTGMKVVPNVENVPNMNHVHSDVPGVGSPAPSEAPPNVSGLPPAPSTDPTEAANKGGKKK